MDTSPHPFDRFGPIGRADCLVTHVVTWGYHVMFFDINKMSLLARFDLGDRDFVLWSGDNYRGACLTAGEWCGVPKKVFHVSIAPTPNDDKCIQRIAEWAWNPAFDIKKLLITRQEIAQYVAGFSKGREKELSRLWLLLYASVYALQPAFRTRIIEPHGCFALLLVLRSGVRDTKDAMRKLTTLTQNAREIIPRHTTKYEHHALYELDMWKKSAANALAYLNKKLNTKLPTPQPFSNMSPPVELLQCTESKSGIYLPQAMNHKMSMTPEILDALRSLDRVTLESKDVDVIALQRECEAGIRTIHELAGPDDLNARQRQFLWQRAALFYGFTDKLTSYLNLETAVKLLYKFTPEKRGSIAFIRTMDNPKALENPPN